MSLNHTKGGDCQLTRRGARQEVLLLYCVLSAAEFGVSLK